MFSVRFALRQTSTCFMIWYDMIWYDMIYLTAIGLTPVAVVQYTFTHKQYTEQHNRHKQNTYNNTINTRNNTIKEKCGPCPVFARSWDRMYFWKLRAVAEISDCCSWVSYLFVLIRLLASRCTDYYVNSPEFKANLKWAKHIIVCFFTSNYLITLTILDKKFKP